jgi:hypothetical protein
MFNWQVSGDNILWPKMKMPVADSKEFWVGVSYNGQTVAAFGAATTP